MKLPCDVLKWNLIPMIKRELVLLLYKKHKLNRTSIAKRLAITKGSVTQYMQGKRAANSKKLREMKSTYKVVSSLAEDIATKNISDEQIGKKVCNICKSTHKKLGVC